MIASIPNILTLSRIILIPIFPMLIWYHSIPERIFFTVLFTIASLTDFFDGYIARTYNINSNFGRIFDPISDKVLILVLCITILIKDSNVTNYILLPILVILVRELIISGIREGLASQNKIIKVSRLAKYKTASQMVALGFLIMAGSENYFLSTIQIIGIIVLYISMFLSLFTGIMYLKNSYNDLV